MWLRKCIFILAFLFVLNSTKAGLSLHTHAFSPGAELYLVNCGVDDYNALFGVQFSSSVNDVRILRDSMSAQFNRLSPNPSALHIHSYTLLDKDATRENILAVLSEITPKMKSEDVLFFSFSGHMLDNLPYSDEKLESPYLITYSSDSSKLRSANGFTSTFLGLQELRKYLELMPCKYQMILLDAGINQKDVGWKFSSVMLKDIPNEQTLTQRNRVLIAPEGSSLEAMKAGFSTGMLTYYVCHFRHTLELFFTPQQTRADLKRYADEDSHRGDYCSVIFENEVLNYLRRFCLCNTATRGASGQNDDVETPVFNKPHKKDLAVIVATNIYNGKPTWNNLGTPMRDAESIEKLLREKYGFETRILANYTKDSLMNELKKLVRDSVEPDQQLFLFFAGHGNYSSDILDGALVMKDSKSLIDDPNMQSYFQFSYLSTFINRLPYKHIFVMLDVCFGGEFGNNNAKVVLKPGGVPADISIAELRKRKKDYEGRLYLASGDKKVPDGVVHSPFAEKIIEKLQTAQAAVTPQDLFQYCEKNVTEPVFRKLADHDDNSEFFFIPVKN